MLRTALRCLELLTYTNSGSIGGVGKSVPTQSFFEVRKILGSNIPDISRSDQFCFIHKFVGNTITTEVIHR